MAKRYKRAKPAKRVFAKKFASDNIQVRAKTKHKSLGAPIIRGQGLPASHIAAYRGHVASKGKIIHPDGAIDRPVAIIQDQPLTQLSLKKWLNVPQQVDRFGKDVTPKLPLVEVLKKLAVLSVQTAQSVVQHEALGHAEVEDAYGRKERFKNPMNIPKTRKLQYPLPENVKYKKLGEPNTLTSNEYFNPTFRMKDKGKQNLGLGRNTVDRYVWQEVYRTHKRIIRLYMSGQKHFFVMFEPLGKELLISRSIFYFGRQRALQVLDQWRFSWEEKFTCLTEEP